MSTALPLVPVPYHDAWSLDTAIRTFTLLPGFQVWERVWFLDSAEGWAYTREQELRDERKAREAERELAAVEWPWP